MTEEELREMFAALEAQGLRPMLCDTPVAVYDGRVPCGTPTLSYGEIVSMAKLPQGLLSMNPEFFVSVQGDSMEFRSFEVFQSLAQGAALTHAKEDGYYMGPICLLVDMDGSCKGKEAWGETEIMEFDKHAKELIQNAIVQ